MKRFATAALTAILLAGTAGSAIAAEAPASSAMPEALPEAVPSDLPRNAVPTHYVIEFTPDAETLTFTGQASIAIEVLEPSEAITLNALDLDIASARLVPTDGGSAMPLKTAIDGDAQTARFTTGQTIAPGSYWLQTSYRGKINTQAMGLFALDYPDKRTGKETRALFTQFEAPDARRFAPTFDEPSYKATFDLTAVVPEKLMPISNMPIASETALGDGTKRVTFKTSPKMSSYLLFFGLGDFERLSMESPNGTKVGIVGPAGSGEQGRFALESLSALLPFYGEYFGEPFPLPKLDNIAGPGQSQFFGAMENWGAVFTFERILLVDPAITSPALQQQIYSTQAHEVAHQWFGDIVTMAWWDDLWLNEGFASWMESKATDHFHPEWFPLLNRVAGRESAMDLDSFATTHPIVQKIRTVSETAQAFDTIAYEKGEAVISMLEAYAGEDVWRDGIRRYIAAHKYGNTVSDDLWRAVEQAGANGITEIAHDFTRQPGIPLVTVQGQCANGQTALTLAQGEFSRDRMQELAASPQHWRVPLLVKGGSAAPIRQVLDGTAELTLPGCEPVIINGGQLGYFRTLYTPEMIAGLTKDMPGFAPIDQLGLTADNLALAQAGYQDIGLALDLLAAVPGDANPVVAEGTVKRWGTVYDMLSDDGAKAELASVAKAEWKPRLDELGFDPKDGEPLADSNLRAELITTLGKMNDETVLEQARSRFARMADNPRALDGPLKTTWLAIAARNATSAEWDTLAKLAKDSTSTIERQAYYQQLGATHDDALAQRALDLSLTGEAGTMSAGVITAVAKNHPDMAFDFVMAHRTEVEAMLDSSGRASFFSRLARSADQPEMLTKLETLRASLPEDERISVDRALASLKQRFDSEPRLRGQIAKWLGVH